MEYKEKSLKHVVTLIPDIRTSQKSVKGRMQQKSDDLWDAIWGGNHNAEGED